MIINQVCLDNNQLKISVHLENNLLSLSFDGYTRYEKIPICEKSTLSPWMIRLTFAFAISSTDLIKLSEFCDIASKNIHSYEINYIDMDDDYVYFCLLIFNHNDNLLITCSYHYGLWTLNKCIETTVNRDIRQTVFDYIDRHFIFNYDSNVEIDRFIDKINGNPPSLIRRCCQIMKNNRLTSRLYRGINNGTIKS